MSGQLTRLTQPHLLMQYLVTCPTCGKTSAAHIDPAEEGVRRLVRLVCPDACALSEVDALAIATLTGEFDLAANPVPA